MCPPVMAAAAIGMAVIGGVMAVQAGNRQAEGIQNRAAYQKAIADNNAIGALQQGDQARLEGAANKSDIRQRALAFTGARDADAAARGVVVSSGSEADVKGDIALAEFHGKAVEDYNTELRVLEARQRAVNFTSQGQLALLRGASEADAARSAGQQAFVSALGSAAKIGASSFGSGK